MALLFSGKLKILSSPPLVYDVVLVFPSTNILKSSPFEQAKLGFLFSVPPPSSLPSSLEWILVISARSHSESKLKSFEGKFQPLHGEGFL